MRGYQLTQINDAKLPELLMRPELTLLLITSNWDGHGIIMRTLLEGLAGRYGNVSFSMADVEQSPRICKIFNVTDPPGLLFVRDGELIDRLQGPVGGRGILQLVERYS